MGTKLNVGFVQFDVTDNINHNVSHVKNEIDKLTRRKIDMIVLPELWSCGFNYNILEDAVKKTNKILKDISNLAKKHNVSILGSLPEKDKDKLYNTVFCIDSNGEITNKYRKIHLFTPLKEDEYFTPGKDITTFLVNKTKVGAAICFDIRFPELIKCLATAGIKILAVCAQWPKVRYFHWITLLKARAIENQIFVIAANRCGKQEDREYMGHSIIINPYGEVVYEALEYEESMDALIDLTLIEQFKRQFDTLALKKPHIYK